MRVATLLQFAFACLLSIAAHASVIPQTYLSFTSDAGDPVGLGQSYYFAPPAGHLVVNTTAAPISGIGFFFDPGLGLPWSGGSFLSGASDTQLAVGQYDATSSASGQPHLDLYVEDRGAINPTGWFHIYDLTFDAIGLVQTLAVTFEQHSNGLAPALHGALLVNSTFDLPDSTAVPEPASWTLMLAGLLLIGFTANRKLNRSAHRQVRYAEYSRMRLAAM
jgi:hypothetical protein